MSNYYLILLFVFINIHHFNGQSSLSTFDDTDTTLESTFFTITTALTTNSTQLTTYNSTTSSTQLTTYNSTLLTTDFLQLINTSTTVPSLNQTMTYALIGVSIAFVLLLGFTIIMFIKYRKMRSFRSDVAYELGPYKNY